MTSTLTARHPETVYQHALVHSGEYSTLEVAELFGVGRSTVYRAIERQRIAAKTDLAEARSHR